MQHDELNGAARLDDVLMTLTRKPEGSRRGWQNDQRAIDRRREGLPASVSDDRAGTAIAGAGPATVQTKLRAGSNRLGQPPSAEALK